LANQNSLQQDAEVSVRPRHAPFGLIMLYLVALLFSPVAVGFVGGVNWRRMGKPERFWPLILLSIVILLCVLLVALIFTLIFQIAQPIFSVVFSGLSGLFLAAWVKNRQQADYQAWIQTYGEPKGDGCLELLGIGIVSSVIGVIGGLILLPALANAATSIVNMVVAQQTFQESGFSLTYPATWSLIDAEDASIQDTCRQVECVVNLRATLGGGAIQILRFDDPDSKASPLGVLDAQYVQAVQDQVIDNGVARLLIIDQQDAILRQIELQSGSE
jgi:hypothetical protein